MTFLHPAQVGDLLRVDAVVANVGRTSIDVWATVVAERWKEPGDEREIVHAFLTFVAVDEDGSPRPVPDLVLVTDEQRGLRVRALRRRGQTSSGR